MSPSEIAVTLAGVAAIAFVLLYFLGPRTGRRAEVGAQGIQEIEIRVKGGYDPDTVRVRAGTPVRLKFYRDETSECSDRVILDAFKINRELPAYQTTVVEFTPETPGQYPFTCGMNMLHGRLVVEPAASEPARGAS